MTSWYTKERHDYYAGKHGVYFISENPSSKYIKIGFSRDISKRMEDLAICFRGDVTVHAIILFSPGHSDRVYANVAEGLIHKHIEDGHIPGAVRVKSRKQGSNSMTEWFEFENRTVLTRAIRRVLDTPPYPIEGMRWRGVTGQKIKMLRQTTLKALEATRGATADCGGVKMRVDELESRLQNDPLRIQQQEDRYTREANLRAEKTKLRQTLGKKVKDLTADELKKYRKDVKNLMSLYR